MPIATSTRMIARDRNASSETSLSEITMISADRMKSVRIAPEMTVFSWSSLRCSTASSVVSVCPASRS